MKLDPKEKKKPILYIGQKYVTLDELKSRPVRTIATLAAPSEENLKEIVLKRYEMEPSGKTLNIVGYGKFSIEQIKEEIKNNTAVGKHVIEVETDWIKFLIEKMQKGEIE